MKKIKVLTSFYHNNYPYQAGQIYDLEDDIADKLEIEKRLIIISTLTNTEIEKAIEEGVSIDSIDLSNYYTKTDIDNLLNENNNNDSTSSYNFIKQRTHVFNINHEENVSGYLAPTGEVLSGDQYTTTHYIEVSKGDYIFISYLRKLVFFNSDKSLYGRGLVIDAFTDNYVCTSPVDGYFRLSTMTKNVDTLIVVIQKESFMELPTAETFNENLNKYELVGIVPETKSVGINELKNEVYEKTRLYTSNLYGKTILNFGDSIGAGDGNDGESYAHLISEKYDCNLMSYAKGGATLAFRDSVDGEMNISTQVDNAIANVSSTDYILIDGGTNDITASSVLGEISENYTIDGLNITTVCGSLETIFYKLRNAYPNAKIVFVRVHKMGSRDASSQKTYGDIIQDICKKWSIAVADIYNEGQLNTFLEIHHQYTNSTTSLPNGDKTHPNKIGYEMFYLSIIESVMNKL